MKLGLKALSRWRSGLLPGALALLVTLTVGACSDSDEANDDGSGGSGGENGDGSGGNSLGGSTPDGGSPGTGGKGDNLGGGAGDSGTGGDDQGTGGSNSTTGGSESGTGGASVELPELHVSTLEELTDKSAPDYGDNEHGVISGGRLKNWIADWEEKRPSAIEGRLVILQIAPSSVTTAVHLTPHEEDGVFTYLVSADDFNVKRSNGVSSFETDIPDGVAADAWLRKYAIDPRRDLIVLTFEQQAGTQNSIIHSIGRAWVFLKYWGVPKEHIAILNGSLNWNATNYELETSLVGEQELSEAPNNGEVTVRHLGFDNTASTISLEEIIAILKEQDGAPPRDEVRIVDARGGAEALGLKKATSTGRNLCSSYTGTAPNAKCSTPFEGRIKGAKSVPWTQFIDTAVNGFRFLPYTTVKGIFDTQSGWDQDAEFTIQYCRTNQRSTVTGIVASVILGYPTRLYETSFIEWGHISAGPAESPNKNLVAPGFAFRTDLDSLTEHAVLADADAGAYTPGGSLGALTEPVTWVAGPNYNLEADVNPPVEGEWPLLDANATTTRLTIDTDRAYLRGIPLEELEE